jgi:hypothetical protein
MIAHVLGWLTAASMVPLSAYVIRFTITAGRSRVAWMPVPEFVEAPLMLSSGADYVGAC